jgi:hypothetical protein
MQRVLNSIPYWLAWPAGALSTLAALGGSALVLHAAAFGVVASAVWAAVAFMGAAAFWFVADVASTNRHT